MSGIARFAGEYGSMVAPDLLEIAARTEVNAAEGRKKNPRQPYTPRLRIRQPNPAQSPPPGIVKQEPVMTDKMPTPEEVQAGLDSILAAHIDGLPTPEARASCMIKVGVYFGDLNKYAPLLAEQDEDTIADVLGQWLSDGDGDLKKMVLNSFNGEEMILAKSAPEPEGPDHELAKMLDAQTDPLLRMAVLQKIGTYTSQYSLLMARAADQQMPQEQQDELTKGWIEQGDGTHLAMKKAVAASHGAARRAATGVHEKDVVEQVIGNASTAVGEALPGGGGNRSSGTPDSGIRATVPERSTGADAGAKPRGAFAIPGQSGGPSPDPGAGVDPEPTVVGRISRGAATGGLGSTRGAQKPGDNDEATRKDKDKKQKGPSKDPRTMDKAELAGELVKIGCDEMVEEIAALKPADQVAVLDVASDFAIDLMAWGDEVGQTLQKRDLDTAVDEWLREDPALVGLKVYVAEALGSAEQIPIALAKTIMEWEPGKGKPVPAAPTGDVLTAQGLRVRAPYATA